MKTALLLDEYVDLVDAEMKSLLANVDSPVRDMITYHLGWTDEQGGQIEGFGGKRLRSTLCLLACKATGGDIEEALPAAAAIELVHNFSLIQDDIQDDDRERRHRPTVWSIWGKQQALNAITAMHVLSSVALARLGKNGTPIQKQQRAQSLLNNTVLEMVKGQYSDIHFETLLDVGVHKYLDMIDGKTAALISCSLEIGALLGTEDKSSIEAMAKFGRYLGFAFQIKDDLLGIWGVVAETGKPNASDILKKKKTLPVVFAFEAAEGIGKEQLVEIYAKDIIDYVEIDTVLRILGEIGAKDFTQKMVQKYIDRAVEQLAKITLPTRSKTELQDVTSFLVDREY